MELSRFIQMYSYTTLIQSLEFHSTAPQLVEYVNLNIFEGNGRSWRFSRFSFSCSCFALNRSFYFLTPPSHTLLALIRWDFLSLNDDNVVNIEAHSDRKWMLESSEFEYEMWKNFHIYKWFILLGNLDNIILG